MSDTRPPGWERQKRTAHHSFHNLAQYPDECEKCATERDLVTPVRDAPPPDFVAMLRLAADRLLRFESALMLHQPYEHQGLSPRTDGCCTEDGKPWPCPTVLALTEHSDEGQT